MVSGLLINKKEIVNKKAQRQYERVTELTNAIAIGYYDIVVIGRSSVKQEFLSIRPDFFFLPIGASKVRLTEWPITRTGVSQIVGKKQTNTNFLLVDDSECYHT